MNHKGLAKEQIAGEYLVAQSLKLINSNFRSSFGEID
jgi:Holliday junction resolvase-like predicted endonuclease